MIDLHMHTTYSDGTDSLKELLLNAEKNKLEIISITDHNNCNSYFEMEKINIKDYFSGNIIVGCEFTTSFNGQLIEVLGYGIDYKIVDKYMKDFYNSKKIKESDEIIFNNFLEKIEKLGLKYDLDEIMKNKHKNIFKERAITLELFNYDENKIILKEDIWNNYSDFYRKGLTNPKSKIFLNYIDFQPSLKEIINLIHSAGGKAFLAHPYQYKLNNTNEFLENLFSEYNLDGIECLYTTFSNKETENLLNVAKSNNLLVSGGSDYHAKNKTNHNLGVGAGNLKIEKSIINNWDIRFL